LAGTCKRYSKNAIPQLTKTAIHQGLALRSFRWAYQANVMNTFDRISSPMNEKGPVKELIVGMEQFQKGEKSSLY
jgi:hypothetical protein